MTRSLNSPVTVALVALFALFVGTDHRHFILNRGFTVWFHYAAFLHVLTQSKFLEKFLIITGTSISFGWYSSILYECVRYGRFFEALYKNMPPLLTRYMIKKTFDGDDDCNYNGTFTDADGAVGVDNCTYTGITSDSQLDFESAHSIIAMMSSHVLDLLGHPILTYYFWRRYKNDSGNLKTSITNSNGNNTENSTGSSCRSIGCFDDVCTWPIVISAYLYSRVWSLVQTYHNFGRFALFYLGHNIYVVESLESWYPAYIAETALYSYIIIRKLLFQP